MMQKYDENRIFATGTAGDYKFFKHLWQEIIRMPANRYYFCQSERKSLFSLERQCGGMQEKAKMR